MTTTRRSRNHVAPCAFGPRDRARKRSRYSRVFSSLVGCFGVTLFQSFSRETAFQHCCTYLKDRRRSLEEKNARKAPVDPRNDDRSFVCSFMLWFPLFSCVLRLRLLSWVGLHMLQPHLLGLGLGTKKGSRKYAFASLTSPNSSLLRWSCEIKGPSSDAAA